MKLHIDERGFKWLMMGGDNMSEHNITKSCPFCIDDEASLEIVEMEHDKFIKYYVRCNECEATGPIATSKTDAIKNWDERPASEIYGIVSPKLDSIRESLGEAEDKLYEIENAIED